jgi:hypothetical protein
MAAVATRKERKFRQYMNRRGGFNRQVHWLSRDEGTLGATADHCFFLFVCQAAGQDGLDYVVFADAVKSVRLSLLRSDCGIGPLQLGRPVLC